ncbi:ABC transporter ATP-binding protein [Paenibacillus donghaensis]|uniref:ABC transporter n=1 Tax=Paenibacillus donghaensis TaxID=414771 RepID=A0A2Z2KDQ3_9BACL|nr:ABC transporter ATP-binding protein [Paenibacillus donghaensis]ASA24856.1 hypothetical protein B9T62_31320 [Paenibacillus donghaensis]
MFLLNHVKKRTLWIFGFLIFFASFENVLFSLFMKMTLDVAENGKLEQIPIIIVSLLASFTTVSAFGYLAGKSKNHVICEFNSSVKNKMYKGILETYSEHINPSSLLSKFTGDSKMIEQKFVQPILLIFQSICIFILSLTLSVTYDLTMTLIFILCSLAPALISVLFKKKLIESSARWSSANENYVKYLKEILMGRKTIRIYNLEKTISQHHDEMNAQTETAQKKMNNVSALVSSLVSAIGMISFFIPIIIGTIQVIRGNLSIGTLLGLLQISNTILSPLMSVIEQMNNISQAKPLIENIKKLNLNIVNHDGRDTEEFTPLSKYEIRISSFSANRNGLPLFTPVDIIIEEGEKVLIAGESGVGKSTVLNIIQGLHNDYTGSVRFADLEVRDLSYETISQSIGLIQQEPFIFDDTIENNIRLWEEFTQDELDRIINEVSLNSIIHSNGKDFSVGEDGKNISGGQKQRIEIARMLIRNKRILLLDEITSALDQKTAENIRQLLFSLPLTVIEVAHNYNSERYDKIICLARESEQMVSMEA